MDKYSKWAAYHKKVKYRYLNEIQRLYLCVTNIYNIADAYF